MVRYLNFCPVKWEGAWGRVRVREGMGPTINGWITFLY